MIKRLFIIAFFIACVFKISAQQYGNEWINYAQKHYRVSIPKTGLYRIDSIALANSGLPLNVINPKNFQLFIKGVEQYIYVKGENDNVFNTTDYIEFYAEKNDCSFDSLAYTNLTRLPNPYVALFNDTNYAYITWNTSLSNRRLTPETDLNFISYTPADYFYNERIFAGNNHYSAGHTPYPSITDPRYIKGEGFGLTIAKGNNYQTLFSTAFVYPSGILPVYIKTSYSGNSIPFNINVGNFDHQIQLDYSDNTGNYVNLNDTTFYGYEQMYLERTITSDKLQNNSVIRITSVSNPAFSAINNQTTIHYISVKYPQQLNLSGLSEQTLFIGDNTSSSKTFLDLQNVGVNTNAVILYDLTNHKYISTTSTPTTVKALIPNSGSEKKCFLTTSANINYINELVPVNQSGYFIDYKSSNVDSAYLIVSHKSLSVSTISYAAYRQSIAGGSNNVIVAYVDELYDQFAYGNTKNPLAIKNLCRYLSDSLNTPPKYLLLLGKSIKNDETRSSSAHWNANLVPTMGIPASDNLLTTEMEGTNSSTPFIPVGRVSAKNDTEAGWYLAKIVSHELGLSKTVPDDWHKHVLHFAGGTSPAEQNLFQIYLGIYEGTISDTSFGGRVYNFRKTTSAPIQITISDSVKQLINYGASIITFFGHGSVSGFDQAIDDPTIYANEDKYPLFIANSCYSGDIHRLQANSTSENFTLIDKKGSIGFIASTSLGLVNTLHSFSSELYKSLAYKTYYKGVGEAMKNASYANSITGSQLYEITALEMTLEGDPFIKLNAFAKPDFEISNTSVYFDTQSNIDSIGINIKIRNLGKAINDTFIVRVERYFPTGDSITFYKTIKAPFNNDTLSFNILKDYINGVGLNHFRVFIDSYNTISELSETNNSTFGNIDLLIPGGDVVPVYPYKYAIIPKAPQVTVKASTADPFSPATNFRIELDTNDTFVSPINSTIVSSTGGVVEWTVNLPFADSTVYFWRITKDSVLPTDRINWRESSFQTISGKTGWAQAHFHQFKNDNYQFVKYKPALRKFDFENDITSINCRNGIEPFYSIEQITYSLNGSTKHIWTCAPDGWTIVIFDSTTAQPRATISANAPGAGLGPLGNCHCDGQRPLYAFDYGTSNGCSIPAWDWQSALQTALNSLPPNTKVLAYSQRNHQTSTFSSALIDEFKKIGSNLIQTVTDTVPLIIFGKKTMAPSPGMAHEVMGAHRRSYITLDDTISTNWNSGYIASEIIGPSTKWKSLHWRQQSIESTTTDSIKLKVIGIRSNGQRDTIETFSKDSTDILDLANYIDAANYPYMQLIAFMSDDINKTPPQLKKWQVIYDEVPECAINPKKGFTVTGNIQEGDDLIIKLPIENIGVLPFTDSLVVTYWIVDKNSVIHPLSQKMKLAPFVASQVIIDTINFTTDPTINQYHCTGTNYLWVDVNPLANAKYQREQYHFNNITRIGFNVSQDIVNPLLDVTFDGTHILNGDVISAKPHVLVTLKDENKFLALNDTSNFAVFIKYPSQASEKRIFFGNALQFTPAQLPSNSCKIEWHPEFAEDGKYKMIVQATDRSKNVSGAVDYNINFEIINKQTVTEVLNYPNPFSTSTRFVFTLTGSETPDIFTIQIMTITGKVVKEITKSDLGNLHIGRNITQYAWDGKDEFGDKLGNGVYLYRVITRHNGQAVEKNATDADSFFKKGIGKMVIMR